ncbi:tryptophan 7-halogenase [Aestuariibacter sp. GS-14]|uniref:tryptophan halogenase family protein n=1 Tax=Aestuariibacter sp. GS-14 TaxID=2590670 RepID=UPI00112A2972|nr:tryptophan halogenase family protein [Aestuariibacter sp. GS-14]TPV59802.1 tryptophan 7-halogenase [Aestuariibacter sp. GS-14]
MNTTTSKTRVVIVGGGTAGWLTAGIIAAHNPLLGEHSTTDVILLESPDVKNLGVGEGTWPTMRDTLKKIGLSEREFLTCCDASFKQASKFVGWRDSASHHYYHPFTAPAGYGVVSLADAWIAAGSPNDFESWVSAQGHACERYLSPKLSQLPEFAFTYNYGYHLNAGKFVAMLQAHCTEKLGVIYRQGHVAQIESHDNGAIQALVLEDGSRVNGDFFIDCSGFAAVLMGKHYQIPFVSQRAVLFNDTAIAAQVHHADEQSPIASATVATAQEYGWIWDIALQSRRGIGHVFASEFCTTEQAEHTLRNYIANDVNLCQEDIATRVIRFDPGHRKYFWHHNCVAIGVSAGFVEPLEATALVLIEKSAQWIAEQLPRTPAAMQVLAKRFNQLTNSRWQEIIDFIKLHYVLSDRTDSPYWRSHQHHESWTESLSDSLQLWLSQPPGLYETNNRQELFSSASKQFVLFGMGFRAEQWQSSGLLARHQPLLDRFRQEIQQQVNRVNTQLLTNREYLQKLRR